MTYDEISDLIGAKEVELTVRLDGGCFTFTGQVHRFREDNKQRVSIFFLTDDKNLKGCEPSVHVESYPDHKGSWILASWLDEFPQPEIHNFRSLKKKTVPFQFI